MYINILKEKNLRIQFPLLLYECQYFPKNFLFESFVWKKFYSIKIS